MEMQVVRNPNVNPMARTMRLAASAEAQRQVEDSSVSRTQCLRGRSRLRASGERGRQSPFDLGRAHNLSPQLSWQVKRGGRALLGIRLY